MQKSDSIAALAKALARAQAAMTGARKESENPFFKSSYADLQSVCEAIKYNFNGNGLSYSQPMGFNSEGKPIVTTILMHESGEWLSGQTLILAKDNSAQAQGSGISYARRYALASIAGLYQADDDGQGAQSQAPTYTPMSTLLSKPVVDPLAPGGTFKEPPLPLKLADFDVNEAQWNRLKAICGKYGWNSTQASEYYKNTMKKTGELRAMSIASYKAVCEYIERNPKK